MHSFFVGVMPLSTKTLKKLRMSAQHWNLLMKLDVDPISIVGVTGVPFAVWAILGETYIVHFI